MSLNRTGGLQPQVEETLAVLTLAGLGCLLLLARFRFPPVGLTAGPPTPGPLDKLAARATYDDLEYIRSKRERRDLDERRSDSVVRRGH